MKVIVRGRLVLKKINQTLNSHDTIGVDMGIVVQDDTVLGVDSFKDARRKEPGVPVLEFDGIILPGLINAHTHLELSVFQNIHAEDFVDWVLKLVSARGGSASGRDTRNSYPTEDLREECIDAKREAGEHGTAYFVNVGNDFELNLSFGKNQLFQFEQLGINDSEAERTFERSLTFLNHADNEIDKALSIHAPYSVSPKLMKKIKAFNNEHGTVTSIHLAETEDEVEFIRTGKGRIADLLNARVGKWEFEPRNLSPVKYIDSLGILDQRTLCVHCVFADEEDLELLGERGSAVVFCIRSNQRLSGKIPELKKFLGHGIRVLLGTDSKASSPDLNMFSEMAAFYNLYHDTINPGEVLRMVTSDAADFIGLTGRYGEIRPGTSASFVYVPFAGKAREAAEFLVTDGATKARMIEY